MATKTKPPKRKEPTPAAIRKWLKEHGHDVKKIDELDLSTNVKSEKSIAALHKPNKEV